MGRLLLVLIACGCELPGFDDQGQDTIPSSAYCGSVENWDGQSASWEEDVLRLVNEARSVGRSCGGQSYGPAAPLSSDGALVCSARVHSKDMGDQGYFSHTSLAGESPGDRMRKAGYAGGGSGENIAQGQRSPEQVMSSWLDSPGHCSNIMNSSWTVIGIGHYSGNYWTQNFGR